MKEQVIASRSSRDQTRSSREFLQRPARRGSSGGGQRRNFSIRGLFRYVPKVLKIAVALLLVATFIIGYRAAASAALFQVRAVDVAGTSRISAEEIESLVRRAVAQTGVWRADVALISSQLQRLPGVRRAVVARVLPDRLRIRISERLPVAVVRTSPGHFIWVDDEGVALGEMKSTDQLPPFFIRGWNEDTSDDLINPNAERVRKYLQLAREWQAVGLADRISEINLIDLRDIRVQLTGDDSQVEVRLGGQDATQRLKSALEVFDRYKQATNGATITYIDSQGPRVTLGFSSGNALKTDASSSQVNNTTIASTSSRKSTDTDANSLSRSNSKSSELGRSRTTSPEGDRVMKNRAKPQRQ